MICQNKFTNSIHYISQISQTCLHCSITMATALHRLKSSPSLAWETSTASHLSFDLSPLLLYSTSIHCQIHIYTVARVIFLKTTAAAAAATTKKQICLCFSFKTPSKFMSRRNSRSCSPFLPYLPCLYLPPPIMLFTGSQLN